MTAGSRVTNKFTFLDKGNSHHPFLSLDDKNLSKPQIFSSLSLGHGNLSDRRLVKSSVLLFLKMNQAVEQCPMGLAGSRIVYLRRMLHPEVVKKGWKSTSLLSVQFHRTSIQETVIAFTEVAPDNISYNFYQHFHTVNPLLFLINR